jgi:hypothetical protein
LLPEESHDLRAILDQKHIALGMTVHEFGVELLGADAVSYPFAVHPQPSR